MAKISLIALAALLLACASKAEPGPEQAGQEAPAAKAAAAAPAASAAPAAPAAKPPAANQTEPAPFKVTELADGVIAVTTKPYASNSLLVRTADGTVILVDTPFTPPDTVELVAWVEKRWGSRPAYAINSHWHNDAAGGNQVLIEMGVEVISSARTAEAIKQSGDKLREDLIEHFAEKDPETAEELKEYRPTPATRVLKIEKSVELVLGGEKVQLIYPGPSHSADSLGIFFPDRALLYGGCMIRSNGTIGNRREADPDNWPRAVEILAKLRPRIVVPGHGARFDPAMLEESIAAARALGEGN